ncbi:MAG TPA: ABC transporter substrate-binding protein [Stellaceae bacterium]|nr:ABC transporter substrate-binding protein [Stellaceae bacterium]
MRHRGHRATAIVLALCVFGAGAAGAADKVKVGLVKVANSGPTYIAQERGYFAAEGLDPELIFFEGGGVPISVAVVSGDIDIGETATSASLFALAGQGAIKIVGGETREAKGFHNFALVATRRGDAAGLKSYADLPGHSLVIPQIGSSAHYRLSLLAAKFGFDVGSVRLLAVQSIPNVISSLKGGQGDGTINAATQLVPLLEEGDVKLIGWLSDEVRYQSAVTFVATKTANERRDLLERYLRAFRKAARDYHDAFTGPDETRVDGPTAPDILAIISKYTGETPARLKYAIAYCPSDGGLDSKDIGKQIDWFKSQGMLKGPVDADMAIDHRYAPELPIQ